MAWEEKNNVRTPEGRGKAKLEGKESGTPPNPEALEVGGKRATSPTGKANPKPYLNNRRDHHLNNLPQFKPPCC
jgi:hypothetical protein